MTDTFDSSIERLRGPIRLHCYRMLGSASDSDDVVQETMLRAWKSKDTLHDPALVKPWLYRIATNVCLDELAKRPRRVLASDAYPPTTNAQRPLPMVEEPIWLEPMPNAWLGDGSATSASSPEALDGRDPHAEYSLKESVALAFCAAIQFLTPLQRATLLLRDVVGLSAEETAEALAIGIPAASSALFRARTAIEEKLGVRASADAKPRTEDVDHALLTQYVRAFEEANLDAIVALFHEDIRTTMPPASTWVAGRGENERFYRSMFGAIVPGQFRHLYIGANGQPALAFYRPDAPGGPHVLAAIQLVGTRDGKVISVDHFMLPGLASVFELAPLFPG